jgi:hypothetical protein
MIRREKESYMQKTAAIALISFLATGQAHADFSILRPGAAPASAAIGPSGKEPLDIPPVPAPLKTAAPKPAQARTASQKTPAAQGFGKQVPLAFALRQIVPRSFTVVYGQGAGKNASVDWTGGRPWRRVLAAAVQPLGLHISIRKKILEIAK